jgi:hypothetical protein
VDPKDIKCPFQWLRKYETMFRTIGFLARQILGIIDCKLKQKEFSFSEHTYKPKEVLFTIKKP